MRPGDAGRVDVTASPAIAVPAYFHPAVAPDAWAELASWCRQGTVRLVVANLADGPGEALDPAWLEAVLAVADAGGRVHGYVDLGHLGSAPPGSPARTTRTGSDRAASWVTQALADLERWHDLLGDRLAGLFLDCAPSHPDRTSSTLLHGLVESQRARWPGSTCIVNPGTMPSPELERLADVVVTFEGSATDHLARPVMARRPVTPAPEVWHIVHGVRDAATARAVAARAAADGATHLTSSPLDGPNPYRALPRPELPRPATARRLPPPDPAARAAQPAPTVAPTTVAPRLSPPVVAWSRHEVTITVGQRPDDRYRRVFLQSTAAAGTGWRTPTSPVVAARWLLENDRLHEYVGDADEWRWRDRGPVPTRSSVSGHTWIVDPHRIGDAAAYDLVAAIEGAADPTTGERARWSPVVRAERF